jgi:hypothetical protein
VSFLALKKAARNTRRSMEAEGRSGKPAAESRESSAFAFPLPLPCKSSPPTATPVVTRCLQVRDVHFGGRAVAVGGPAGRERGRRGPLVRARAAHERLLRAALRLRARAHRAGQGVRGLFVGGGDGQLPRHLDGAREELPRPRAQPQPRRGAEAKQTAPPPQSFNRRAPAFGVGASDT